VVDPKPSTRRTVLVLGGMTAAAVVLFALMRHAGFGEPLPRVLTDEAVSDDDREAAIRKLVQDTPPAERPKLIRRVARLPEGDELAHRVLEAAIEIDPQTANPVLDAYRKRYPDPQTGYACLLKLRLKQGWTEEAVAIFRGQSTAAGDEVGARQGALWPFLESMTQTGLPVRAYREAERRQSRSWKPTWRGRRPASGGTTGRSRSSSAARSGSAALRTPVKHTPPRPGSFHVYTPS
jgi:hypothetical protein